VDTGSDGTLIPTEYLEQVEAIGIGDAVLYGVVEEARRVHLYEIDLHIGSLLLPGVVVVGDDHGHEVVLGRNINGTETHPIANLGQQQIRSILNLLSCPRKGAMMQRCQVVAVLRVFAPLR
jgi:hypothetical protein